MPKITELTEITSPSDDDMLYIVDSPGSAPASRKISVANLLQSCLKLVGGILTGDLTIPSSNALYLGSSGTNGSWRFVRSGDNLVIQRRESDAWVDKGTITA